MAKGYVVANIRVTDQDRFQQFAGMAGPAIKKYGGKVLARGPGADRLERLFYITSDKSLSISNLIFVGFTW